MRRSLALALSLLLAAPALGAAALDPARAAADQAHRAVASLTQEQAERRAELDALSRQIEALKARRERTAGPNLEADLRRSQALSDQLAALSRALFEASHAAQDADLTLLGALNAELERQQQAAATSDRGQRERILQGLRALRAERESVRARLPTSVLPALTPAQTDDPTTLLEQADALRDSEDKVRRQLAQLDARIAEMRSERELDRRMRELSHDDSLFDEQDRQLRVTRAPDGVLSVDTPTGGGSRETFSGPAASPVPTGAPGVPSPMTDGQPAEVDAHASDHQPPFSELGAPAAMRDDLATLERERARLSQLAQTLEAQAQAAERKARGQP